MHTSTRSHVPARRSTRSGSFHARRFEARYGPGNNDTPKYFLEGKVFHFWTDEVVNVPLEKEWKSEQRVNIFEQSCIRTSSVCHWKLYLATVLCQCFEMRCWISLSHRYESWNILEVKVTWKPQLLSIKSKVEDFTFYGLVYVSCSVVSRKLVSEYWKLTNTRETASEVYSFQYSFKLIFQYSFPLNLIELREV